MNKAVAILTGDLHLKAEGPSSRKDDYHAAFIRKLKAIQKLHRDLRVPVLIPGDIFDHWKAPPEVISMAMRYLPPFVATPGQHDLPYHDMARYSRSALRTLELTGRATVLGIPGGTEYSQYRDSRVYGCPYGVKEIPNGRGEDILLIHRFVWTSEANSYPGAASSGEARVFIRNLRGLGFRTVVCGDNHSQFVVERDGITLVNSGSVMRGNIKLRDQTPRIYVLMDDGSAVPVDLPHEEDVWTDKASKEKNDHTFDKFVEGVKGVKVSGSDFRTNMKVHFENQPVIRKGVKTIVDECMEGKE